MATLRLIPRRLVLKDSAASFGPGKRARPGKRAQSGRNGGEEQTAASALQTDDCWLHILKI